VYTRIGESFEITFQVRFFVRKLCDPILNAPILELLRGWKHSKLRHQSKRIHDKSRGLNFLPFELIDDYSPNSDASSCGLNTEEGCAMSSTPSKSRDDLVFTFNLLFHDPLHVGKGFTHSTQNVLQPFNTWTLPWKRHFFHHVGTEIFTGGINGSSVQDSIDKLTDEFGFVFHRIKVSDQRPQRQRSAARHLHGGRKGGGGSRCRDARNCSLQRMFELSRCAAGEMEAGMERGDGMGEPYKSGHLSATPNARSVKLT